MLPLTYPAGQSVHEAAPKLSANEFNGHGSQALTLGTIRETAGLNAESMARMRDTSRVSCLVVHLADSMATPRVGRRAAMTADERNDVSAEEMAGGKVEERAAASAEQ